MVMRNAFEDMATEVTARALVKALNLARDTVGRLRVSVDTSALLPTHTYFGNNNAVPSYYSTGAPTSMDAREQQRLASLQNANISRQKWTY